MITSSPTKRISAISQLQTFLESFTHKMAANAGWHQNCVTVTPYVLDGLRHKIRPCAFMRRTPLTTTPTVFSFLWSQ